MSERLALASMRLDGARRSARRSRGARRPRTGRCMASPSTHARCHATCRGPGAADRRWPGRSPTRLGDHGWSADRRVEGRQADVIEGDVGAAWRRVGADRLSRPSARGWEGSGVSRIRDAATWRPGARLRARRATGSMRALRYADSIEQSHCAHVMTRDVRAGVVGRRATGPRRRRGAPGHRRPRLPARARDRPAGARLRGPGPRRPRRADGRADRRASQLGEATEAIELILPPLWGLAEVGAAGRRPGAGVRALPRRAPIARGRRRAHPARAVRRDRRPRRAGRRPAGRGGDVGSTPCAAHLAPIPDVAGRGARPRTRAGRARRRRDRLARIALEAAVAGWDATGRIWEATWARLDLAQLPGPLEPVRGGASPRRRRPGRVGRPARFAGPRRPCRDASCAWPAAVSRTTSRGARSPRANSRSRGSIGEG